MNKAILTGRIGKDAEIKRFESGNVKVTFSIAITEKHKDKLGSGTVHETTEWHSIVMWGERAEKIAQYLTKGKLVLVEGRVSPGRYEAEGAVKFAPFINAMNVEFLAGGKNNDSGDSKQAEVNEPEPVNDVFEGDDDLPF